MPDSGCRIPDAGCRIPDSGCRIQFWHQPSAISHPESGIWNLESDRISGLRAGRRDESGNPRRINRGVTISALASGAADGEQIGAQRA